MINIQSAETYAYMMGVPASFCDPSIDPKLQITYCFLLPLNGSSKTLNCDSIRTEDTNDSEKDCEHVKFEGTLQTLTSWSDGVTTFIPKGTATSLRSDGVTPECIYTVLDDGIELRYPWPYGPEERVITYRLNGYGPTSYDRTVEDYRNGEVWRQWTDVRYGSWSTCYPPQLDINTSILMSELSQVAFPPMALNHTSKVACSLFRAACQGVMPLEMNNISNAAEILSAVISIPKLFKRLGRASKKVAKYISLDDIRKLRNDDDILHLLRSGADPHSAADAWLTYRYVYTTTKLDFQLLMKHLKEQMQMWNVQNRRRPRRMHASTSFDSVDYSFFVDISPKLSNAVEEAWVLSRAFGFQLNAANVWDMIPFSFIVDWFAPIGDIASYLDDKALFNETHFKFGSCMISGKTEKDVQTSYGTIHATLYNRKKIPIPTIQYEENSDPSTKTKIYRGIDAAALVVGSR